MKKTNLKINIFFNILKSLMGIIFPLISFPYASRILLPDGIGKVNFVNSVVDYFLMIALLGINTYAAREGAKLRNDGEKLSVFAKEVFFINFISTLTAILMLVLSLLFIDSFSAYKTLLLITSVKIIFTLLGFDWLYIAEEEFAYITFRSFVFQLMSLVFLLAFVRKKEDYVIYALIGVFSSVGSNVCNFFYSRNFVSLFKAKIIGIKRHLKPIFIFFGASCAARIQSTVDTVMLGIMSGDSSVGFYSAAIKLVKIVNTMINTISATLLPRSSFYIQNNESEKYQDMLEKSINITIYLSLPSCMGLVLLCAPLIRGLSGEAYLPAFSAMCISVPTILFGSLGTLVDSLILIPEKKEKFTFYFQIISCVINIGLNLFLIPFYGAFGAALATGIVEFIIMALKIFVTRKKFISKNVIRNMLISIVATVMMGIVVYQVRFEQDFLKISVSLIAGCTSYGIATVFFRHDSARIILSVLIKRIWRK